MSMEIGGIVRQAVAQTARQPRDIPEIRRPPDATQTALRPASPNQSGKPDLAQIAEDLGLVSGAFNRRLKFSINHELEQVVVKVIDTQTDKVIKELPPEALQRLHVRIREAIGLLIDEEI